MKKLFCITLAAMLLLSSCAGGNDSTDSSQAAVSSQTVSLLNNENSTAIKYLSEKLFDQDNVCQMEIERSSESGKYSVCIRDDGYNVSLSENGEEIQYVHTENKIYRVNAANKTATVVEGTKPYAVTLADYCSRFEDFYFFETGTTEVDGVSYKSETFYTSQLYDDTSTFCLNEDGSVAIILFNSASDAKYNVTLKIDGFTEPHENMLFEIPEEYTVA